MDFKRTFLFLSLAVVGYMLITTWQQDYGQKPVTASPAAEEGAVTALDELSGLNEVAAAVDNDGDVPVVRESAPQAALAPASNKKDQLIRVETDVLTVLIDKVGGDIVHVSLKNYPVSLEAPETGFVLLDNSPALEYVAQSGLIGANGPDKNGRAVYESEATVYQMTGDELAVELRMVEEGVSVVKQFLFKASQHDIAVDYFVDNQSGEPWTANLFGQVKRDGSSDPSSANTGFGLPTFLGAAYWTGEKPYNKLALDDFEDLRTRGAGINRDTLATVRGGWVAMAQHYFISAWVPNKEQLHDIVATYRGGNHIISFVSPSQTIEPSAQGRFSAVFYAGPKTQSSLKALSPGLERSVDYGVLFFISEPLFKLLEWLHSLVGNWGVAIILLTVVVKAMFYWLSAKSYRSMANMRRVTPELTRIRQLYSDDRQKMSQAMMELYRKEKINPLGGCLPILVQMPVFLALYWALLESVELRQAPFFGWIQDLSDLDPYFVLPILMGVSMYGQQLLNPTPPDPMQAKVMKMLPVIFTVFFLFFPSGLVLYWLTNNILSIAQQWWITRGIEKQAAEKKANAK